MRSGPGVRRAAVIAGREVELDFLLRAVRAARAGAPSCTVLLGEGGVGKTRLLSEAAAASRQFGLGVLAGRAPIATPVAFSVVAEAMRSWLRGHPVAPTGSPFDRGLGLVLPERASRRDTTPELSPAQLRLLAFEGIVQLVREIAAANDGAVVLLDDLHAADPDSLEATRYLATAGVEGVAIICALRSGEAAIPDELVRSLRRDGVADIVEVTPLDERAVTDLVAALLDADPPEPLVADIMARTDGVPLLVEEVLDAHIRAGSVEVGAEGTVWRGGAVAVPRTVREMVEGRLERLAPAQRDVLVAGAVVGDFEPGLLATVAAADAATINDALTDGLHVGLLETTGGAIGFRHAVIREAVIAATGPHVIAAMHQRAADALDDGRPSDAHLLERRAHHLTAVGAHDDAGRMLAGAAEAHLRDHALLSAERLARAALELARTPATRSSAADGVARALAAQGRWSEALDVDGASVREHGETPARRHRMATSALEADQPELAGEIITRAIEAGDDSAFIQIAAGRVAIVSGDASHALACANRVLDERAGDDLDARLSALDLRARAFDFLGEREAAQAAWTQQAEEARLAGRTQAQLRAVVQLGKIELFAGQRPRRLHEAVDVAREAGAFVELAWAEENLAIGLSMYGDHAAASSLLADAIPRCRELRLDQLAYLIVAKAGADSYTVESVAEQLAEAEALLPTAAMRMHIASLRGDIALRRGDYDDAVHWFAVGNEIMQSLPGVVPSDTPCWLVWALAAAGRADDAAAALRKAEAIPDLARWHGRPVLVAAARALLAGDEGELDATLNAATGHMLFDVAVMRVMAAEILKGPSQLRWLRQALDAYEASSAPIAADRVRRLLRNAGGSVPRRRRKAELVPGDLAKHGVTAREAEVLRLLGDGLSNAEIAQRLYLSVRTVETHVSSLLTKLDARGRGQLTALSASIPYDA